MIIVGLAVVVLAILIVAGLQAFIIPRTELEVRTVYHESSGGGTAPLIDFNVRFTNEGTRDINSLIVNVEIYNSTGHRVATRNLDYTGNTLLKGERIDLDIPFYGSQLEDYKIRIGVAFQGHRGYVETTLEHITHEPEMNQEFVDLVKD